MASAQKRNLRIDKILAVFGQHNIQGLSTALCFALCEAPCHVLANLSDTADCVSCNEQFARAGAGRHGNSPVTAPGSLHHMRWTRRRPPMDGLYWGRLRRWPDLEPELVRFYRGLLMSYPASEPRNLASYDLFCGPIDPPPLPEKERGLPCLPRPSPLNRWSATDAKHR